MIRSGKGLWPDSFPIFSDMLLLPPWLTVFWGYPLQRCGDILSALCMESKGHLALPVQLPATAGIPGRAVLSRMTDSIRAQDGTTHCMPQDTSQQPKGLVWKTVRNNSAVPWEESKSPSPVFQAFATAANLVNTEDPWEQVELQQKGWPI